MSWNPKLEELKAARDAARKDLLEAKAASWRDAERNGGENAVKLEAEIKTQKQRWVEASKEFDAQYRAAWAPRPPGSVRHVPHDAEDLQNISEMGVAGTALSEAWAAKNRGASNDDAQLNDARERWRNTSLKYLNQRESRHPKGGRRRRTKRGSGGTHRRRRGGVKKSARRRR